MCRNQPVQQSGDKMRGGEESAKVPSSPPGRPRQQQVSRLRVVVLGAEGVGKSALTVRYLTRRYISEYRRSIDLLYRHTVCLDDVTSEVEILDVSFRESEYESVSPRTPVGRRLRGRLFGGRPYVLPRGASDPGRPAETEGAALRARHPAGQQEDLDPADSNLS
nr:uncharacterized protein LOC113825215 [Penaeus vannamei]